MLHSRNLNSKINWIHEKALRLVYQNNHRFSEILDLDNSVTVHEKICKFLWQKSIKLSESKNGIDSSTDNERHFWTTKSFA